MTQYKIIFTGPVGAGKTTAINSISDVPALKTEASASDMTKLKKATTTVALDYGVITLDEGEKVHLYGTPGQERFGFMWDMLVHGAMGLVLLLDNTRPDPINDMRFFLEAFKTFISETNITIGITQMDLQNSPTLSDYRDQLQRLGLSVTVLEIDARNKRDVSLLVRSALSSLNVSFAN